MELLPIHYQLLHFYIPLYNITDNIFQYWERGVSFKRTLTTLCEKYYPLRDEVFQIERIGAKGDPNTTYDLLNVTEDYVNDGLMEEIQEKSEGEEIADVFSEEAGLSEGKIEFTLSNVQNKELSQTDQVLKISRYLLFV